MFEGDSSRPRNFTGEFCAYLQILKPSKSHVIAIQWSLLIAFETMLFCDNVVAKCWLVIGSKAVMTTRPRSKFKTFLHKTAGKLLVLLSNIVGKTFITM